MVIKRVAEKNIIEDVKSQIATAKKEIAVTMLLREEIEKPLPKSYQKLLKKKIAEGISLIRLGFGSKEEYNQIREKYSYGNNYSFRLIQEDKKYQRMIIIDDRIVFFKIGVGFFKSRNKLVVKAFKNLFNSVKMKESYG